MNDIVVKARFNMLISTYKLGRALYSIIRKDEELIAWINLLIPQTTNLPEQLYCIINKTTPICENGKIRFFKDTWAGYYRCGRDNTCKCWLDNQSKKISDAKNLMSKEQWNLVIKKRKKTNLVKYGSEFAAQNNEVKDRTANSNIEKYGVKTTLLVPSVQEKIKDTLLDKYDVDNPMKNLIIRATAMNTCLDRYGHVVYPHSVDGEIRVKDTLKEKYNVSSISQLKFSQLVRDLLQDTDRFHKEYFNIGINGLCEKYPELNYNMCRTKLLREGVTDVIKHTKPESFIKNFLDKHNIVYQVNNRKIIPPLELDFYIPSHNLAIEVCGLYWHREELLTNSNYHLQKLEKCLEKGIKLLTIFSDQIEKHPDIVMLRLQNKLGLLPRLCHARKLKIINNSDKTLLRDFLNNTHIQGTKLGTINLSAIDEHNNIMAVMTFGKSRLGIGKIKNDTKSLYEMYRFSSSGNIPGIASKLFKYFINHYQIDKILSYSDRCWGEGELYEKLGFLKISNTVPNYWYTNNFIDKLHRFGFAKYKLIKEGFDSSLTEFKIMSDRGYSRIYDCGSNKYLWNRALT